MNADGSDPRRLTRNRGVESSPTWSPDGRHIAFSSDHKVHDPGGLDTRASASPNAQGACNCRSSRSARHVDVGYSRASVIAGSASVTIYAQAGPGSPRRGLLRAGAALRPFTRTARQLPAPGLPATLLRRLRRTERAHRSAGGVARAALALDVKPLVVRRRLRLARAVNSLPRIRALRCNRS